VSGAHWRFSPGTLIRTVSNSGENMIASQLEIASDQSQKGKEMISV
jgi:hypothetical protein